MTKFKDFPIAQPVLERLDALGFTTPTEIQAKAFPILLTDKQVDFHGQAQTGTGKTLAFGIPLLCKIDPNQKRPQALIVAPTRELVVQICESLANVAKDMNLVIAPIYGGVSIIKQLADLKRGVHIVVGTPGRLIDHLNRRTLDLSKLKTFVLDEADIMLDMGFKDEIDEILNCAPDNRQIWLFSATVKSGIADLKRTHMKDPVVVSVTPQTVAASTTKQYFCVVPMRFRLQALSRFIDNCQDFYGMIFCQTKILASEVAEKLSQRGYRVGALHGDLDQKMRNKVIESFKKNETDIVVATDVAARGIDIAGLTHVVNYSFPDDQESYIHRIGRTGRAGKDGVAITLVGQGEVRRITQLSKRFKTTINPIEIPAVADVVKTRTANALTYLTSVCSQELNGLSSMHDLKNAVNDLSKEQLANGIMHVLSDKFLREYLHERDIIPAFSSKEALATSNDALQEIMINLGLDDGITRDDIISCCLGANGIDKHLLERVRVIKRRSFITLPSRIAGQLVGFLKSQKIKGRTFRVGFAPERENDYQQEYRRPNRPRSRRSY